MSKTITFQLGQAFGQVIVKPAREENQVVSVTLIRTTPERNTQITSPAHPDEETALNYAKTNLEIMGATGFKEYDLSKFSDQLCIREWHHKGTHRLQRQLVVEMEEA